MFRYVDIYLLKKRAKQLNLEKQGDQVIIYFKKDS